MTGQYAIRVGTVLRTVRVARGMTLDHVERASDGRFRAGTVSSWERADKNLYVTDLLAYAAWLGVHPRILLPLPNGGPP